MSLLVPLLVVLPVAALAGWMAYLHHQRELHWTRILASKLEGPLPMFERPLEEEPAKAARAEDKRRRLSIPVPVGPWSRSNATKS